MISGAALNSGAPDSKLDVSTVCCSSCFGELFLSSSSLNEPKLFTAGLSSFV